MDREVGKITQNELMDELVRLNNEYLFDDENEINAYTYSESFNISRRSASEHLNKKFRDGLLCRRRAKSKSSGKSLMAYRSIENVKKEGLENKYEFYIHNKHW